VGGKTNPMEQDENHEGADVETKAPHGIVPEWVADFILPTMFPKNDSLFHEGGS